MTAIHIFLPIEIGPDALETIAARLNRHLYGKAKVLTVGPGTADAGKATDAGSPLPTKPALTPEPWSLADEEQFK